MREIAMACAIAHGLFMLALTCVATPCTNILGLVVLYRTAFQIRPGRDGCATNLHVYSWYKTLG